MRSPASLKTFWGKIDIYMCRIPGVCSTRVHILSGLATSHALYRLGCLLRIQQWSRKYCILLCFRQSRPGDARPQSQLQGRCSVLCVKMSRDEIVSYRGKNARKAPNGKPLSDNAMDNDNRRVDEPTVLPTGWPTTRRTKTGGRTNNWPNKPPNN